MAIHQAAPAGAAHNHYGRVRQIPGHGKPLVPQELAP